MKKINIIFIYALVLFVASCKSEAIHIHVADTTNSIEKLRLSSKGNLIAEVTPVNNVFEIDIKKIKSGYYNLNNTTLYLAPGFNLNINYTKETVSFEGKGSKENQILNTRIYEEPKYKPLAIDSISKSLELNLNDYKNYVKQAVNRFDKSIEDETLDRNFVLNEKKRTQAFSNYLMLNYTLFGGLDLKGNKEFMSFMKKANPKMFKDPKIKEKFMMLKKNSQPNKPSKAVSKSIEDSLSIDSKFLNDEILYTMKSYSFSEILKKRIASYSRKPGYAVEKKEAYNLDFVPSKFLLEMYAVSDSLTSDYIKEEKLAELAKRTIKITPKYGEDAYKIYMASNPKKEAQIEAVKTVYNTFKATTTGASSKKFVNYKTPEDKSVSLDDLLGENYIYIDVWATWCGPCKKEIPYLKKLEEEYRKKNITFVSISVDTEKNRSKWKQMVKDMELKGVQIMADKDFSSAFIKAYNIASIPRFILIDPKGNIVESSALRPSDPNLKLQLDKLVH